MRDHLEVARHWALAHKSDGVKPNWLELLRVFRMYGRPRRYYHTVHHIAECLRFLKLYGDDPALGVVRMALIYHDCIYEVGSKTNELDSATEWRRYGIPRTFTGTFVAQVEELIRLTASHELLEGPMVNSTRRQQEIMIDTDMSILGAEAEAYLAYAKAIWQEYRSVGAEAYFKGREHFLKHLVPTDIFRTPEVKQTRIVERTYYNTELERIMLPEIVAA